MSEPDQSEKLSFVLWLVITLVPLCLLVGAKSFRIAALPAMLFWLALPVVLFWLIVRCLPLKEPTESDTHNLAVLRSAINTTPLHEIEVLAQWVKHTDRTIHELAAARLIQLAGTASVEQISGLMIEQREALYECINLGNALEHPGLVNALLALVERVHDPHALPFVRGLAEGTSYLPNTDRAIAKAKAVQALLEAEIGHTHSKAVLLRPTGPDNTLLRPVQGSGADVQQNLLRPGAPDE
jgi:hypothetical protein